VLRDATAARLHGVGQPLEQGGRLGDVPRGALLEKRQRRGLGQRGHERQQLLGHGGRPAGGLQGLAQHREV
jgi:hypothetical protein